MALSDGTGRLEAIQERAASRLNAIQKRLQERLLPRATDTVPVSQDDQLDDFEAMGLDALLEVAQDQITRFGPAVGGMRYAKWRLGMERKLKERNNG